MNLLRYEFIDGPDDSINGMLRKLVTDLRYNQSMVPIDEFKRALPGLKIIEQRIQQTDREISLPHRNYIEEIMQELDIETENETNLTDDLCRAVKAVVDTMFGEQIDFNDFSYSTGKSEHFHWLRFSGYIDKRAIDANLIIAREVFRSISNKYNYIFIDLS